MQEIVQVVTNLVVGWLSGWLGVRRALQQSKQQQGFNRRLEWYERTVRTALRQRALIEKAVVAVNKQDFKLMERLLKDQPEILNNFEQAADESMVFAEKTTYISFNRAVREYARKIREMPEDPNTDLNGAAQTYGELVKLIERACLDLSKSIRKQLGLDQLTMQDVESP